MQNNLKSRYLFSDIQQVLKTIGIEATYSNILKSLLDLNIEIRIADGNVNQVNYIIKDYETDKNLKYFYIKRVKDVTKPYDNEFVSFLIFIDSELKKDVEDFKENNPPQIITKFTYKIEQTNPQEQIEKYKLLQKQYSEYSEEQKLIIEKEQLVSYLASIFSRIESIDSLFITLESYKKLLDNFNTPVNNKIINEAYPEELKIAISVYDKLYIENSLPKGKSNKSYIEQYLKKEYPRLSDSSRKRITTVINPNKKGGTPKL
jgi:hypothetical protein